MVGQLEHDGVFGRAFVVCPFANTGAGWRYGGAFVCRTNLGFDSMRRSAVADFKAKKKALEALLQA